MKTLRGWNLLSIALAVCCTAVQAAPPNLDCPSPGNGTFPAGTGSVQIICQELPGDTPGANCGGAPGQVSGAGATLFVDFFRSPAGYNDWIDVDVDTWSGDITPTFPLSDPLATLWPPNGTITTHWMFQYRSVGSVNGYNQFVQNQLCHAIPLSIPAEGGLFNQFEYATGGVRTWGGPYGNNSGTPTVPCEIEFSFLDVPSVWGTQIPDVAGVCVPGGDPCVDDLDCLPTGRCSTGPTWEKEPAGVGYGLDPMPSSSGYISNLQSLTRQCGTCNPGGEDCTTNEPANLYCATGGAVCDPVGGPVSLNTNLVADTDTIRDFIGAWVPVLYVANRGTGLKDVKYSEMQYLMVTGRMPNGENLIGGTRSVGSGTRNAHMNSSGIDTSWGRGDNFGPEVNVTSSYNLGANTQRTNGGGSSQTEQGVEMARLTVAYTGMAGPSRAVEDATGGRYELLNLCKDVDTHGNPLCDCTAKTCPEGPKHCAVNTSINCTANAALCNPTSTNGACVADTAANPSNGYVRPSVNAVLDNADPCCGYTIGGNGSFVVRGERNANRLTSDPEYQPGVPLDNQAVADYINNIADSIRDYVLAGNFEAGSCNFSEVCSSKRCSVSMAVCTGTGIGSCAAGNVCQFIPCDTVVPVACPGGFGTCIPNNTCLNDSDCADKGCSVTNVDCNTAPDCIDETCVSNACTQTGGPCTLDTDCPARGQTCDNDSCRGSSNMPAQYLATNFFLPQGIDAQQDLTDGMVFTAGGVNQALQNYIRGNSLIVVPGFGSVNSAGRVPVRNSFTLPSYSDGSTTGSYTYYNSTTAAYVTNFASGQRLACRNRIAGDFNKDCVRDINDASELVKAQYTPRAWQLTAPANGAPAACMATLPCDSGQQAGTSNQNAIPEVMGDFNGDGNLNKEDLRYFADGLAMSGGALNRKAGAIAIDAAILAAGRALPWNDPAQSLTVPVGLGMDPTHTAPIDVNDAGSPFLKTGKVYANGDFRGDVAGTNPTAGAQPIGWDSVVDGKDIDYCCYHAQIGDWSSIDDAVYIDLSCDMTGDLDVDADDVAELVEVILGTAIGDVDLDGDVDDDDRAVASATIAAGAGGCNGTASCGWADGDTNCDKIVDESDLASVPPSAPLVDPNAATTRTLGMTLTPAATATGSGRQIAIKVTMVDLQQPVPANVPANAPKNFTSFDTRANGLCVGGSHNGHRCGTDADCRLCASGNGAGLPCTADSDCRRCVNDISITCTANPDCVSVGGNCGTAGVCPATGGTCGGLTACTAAGEGNGCARWVGKPERFRERQEVIFSPFDYLGARLQCTPFYYDFGAEGLIHVFGGEILPSSRYTLETYAASCKGNEGSCVSVSAPVEIRTRRYGDVVSPHNPPSATTQPDASDIGQLVAKFKSQTGSPSNTSALLQPNIPDPNSDVGASDIVQGVDAAKSFEYPFGGPCPCPSLATCGAVPCPGGAGTCVASGAPGLGPESTCIKLCRGGTNAGEQCNNHNHCGGGGVCDKECLGGVNVGLGCSSNGDCPGSTCAVVTNNAFCRDRCGRCTP